MARGETERECAVRLKDGVLRRAVSLQRDRLLLGAVATCALLLGFQLVMTLRQPPWIGPVTDWLRTALAWPELLILVAVSRWLTRRRRLEAVSWWLLSGGALCYAIARTWWTVDDTLVYHHGVPFPILPDLFFVLQYPFYFLAVILIPFWGFWGPRLLAVLDALLWIGAATALSWYFLLAPLFAASGLSPLARAVSLGYPIADLFLLLALMLILLRQLRHSEDFPVVGLIIAAVACLVVADTAATLLILHPAHVYRTGGVPDLFWLAADLLIPLAALVQVRVVQGLESAERRAPEGQNLQDLQGRDWEDVRAALRLFLPFVAALVASVAILLRAATSAAGGADWRRLVAPLAVTSGLLLLVIVRQAVMFLETARLRHAMVAAQAEQWALRELDQRKDAFLTVVSHELRTPLASLELFFALLARRFATLPPREASAAGQRQDRERGRDAEPLHTALDYAQASVRRLARLADDLVDDTRIRHGRLAVHLEPSDLGTIVHMAVEEQRAAEPDRTLLLDLPGDGQPVLVLADAERIAQVVTNYLTNALKYSKEDQPVVVRLDMVEGGGESNGGEGELGDVARVSVHDEGIGIPLAEQQQVWERFAVVAGTTVQSGSGVSLGLGLHLSKSIIEAHHGHVGLDSVPGQGTTFWFTLPLAHPIAASPGAG
jgi:signal transduction histidine kinase